MWLVHCFVVAIFEHDLGPGASRVQAGAVLPTYVSEGLLG